MYSLGINGLISTFVIVVISAILSVRAIKRFMDGKIEQWSWEYQICGYLGMNVAVFGGLFFAGNLLSLLLSFII